MANSNVPSGLAPVSYLNGTPWNGKASMYYVPSGNTDVFAIGDPVATAAGTADSAGILGVKLATAGDGNAIRGVVVGATASKFGAAGFDPTSMGNVTVIPATKTRAYYILVVDDPFVIFEIQQYGSTYTVADVGKNCNLKSGTNNGYVSGWTLDDTAASVTTSTRQLKLLGLVQRADNAAGAYAKWLVQINNHELKAGVAGV